MKLNKNQSERGISGCSLAIGVFDGLHRGHAAVISHLIDKARSNGLPPRVLTFSTHPDRLTRKREPNLLCTLNHRLALLKKLGVEKTIVMDFDEKLKNMEASEFASEILVKKLDCRLLIMGFDSAFGKGRKGDLARMSRLGQELGFNVNIAPTILFEGHRISSSTIRELLKKGDLEGVKLLLGRHFSMMGRVVHGKGMGRKLGFPTANLDLPGQLLPPFGVYSAWVTILDKGLEKLPAIVNAGLRPTFDNDPAGEVVEVHLIDYDGSSLYGETLELSITSFLRPERAFPSQQDLIDQIDMDIKKALTFLKQDLDQTIDSSPTPPTMPPP